MPHAAAFFFFFFYTTNSNPNTYFQSLSHSKSQHLIMTFIRLLLLVKNKEMSVTRDRDGNRVSTKSSWGCTLRGKQSKTGWCDGGMFLFPP